MKKKRLSLKRHLNETARSSYQVILEGDGWLLKGKIAKKKKKSTKELRLKTTSESQSDQFSKKISGGKKANLQTSTKKGQIDKTNF